MWDLSSSSDPRALAVVDGTGRFAQHGPHYSRRTPGSRTFTGVGREIVLLAADGTAVWAVVLQKTSAAPGTGSSRGRTGDSDVRATNWVWRNMLFRNLGSSRSSDLIRSATARTYLEWMERYGELPLVPLRTEVDPRRVRSTNPGYCYQCAGWRKGDLRRGKLFLYAPLPDTINNRFLLKEEDQLEALGRTLSEGEEDAYSHWCSGAGSGAPELDQAPTAKF